MNPSRQRIILRWVHIAFGLPILGYIYGPPEEVLPYAPIFQYLFVPVIVLSGLWMWKGEALWRRMAKTSGGSSGTR